MVVVPESKSEWDGREKFFEQWDEDRGGIRYYINARDYASALDFLSTWIVNFSGYTDLDVEEVRREINNLIGRLQEYEQYNDEVFINEAGICRREIENKFYVYMTKLTHTMNKLRMLVPMSEIMGMDDAKATADAYERLVYGDVNPASNKEIPALMEYDDSYPFIDENLKEIIMRQRWLNEKCGKDCLWILFGRAGAGKSTLANHSHDYETGGNPDISNVAFDREEFSIVIDRSLSRKEIHLRVTHYDEANITKREAMSNWNKSLIDLYDAIRGDHGFHLWCNPSAQYLETKFISERVNALIYVFEGNSKTRRYALIPRKKIMELIEKKGDLKFDTMDKYARDFSINNGWFKRYINKDFMAAYDAKKEARMKAKREKFREDWGEESNAMSGAKAAKELGVSTQTITKYVREMVKEGVLNKEDTLKISGHVKINNETLEKIKQRLGEKHEF